MPAGYLQVSGWSVSGTNATATTIGGSTTLGSVTTTGTNQTVAMTGAPVIDTVAVPLRALTNASFNASDTECLNGALVPVDSVRECDGNTSRQTVITFPFPVMNPILAVAARGAINATPTNATVANKTFCAASWTDHAVIGVNGAFPDDGQVTAVSLGTGQQFDPDTSEVIFDTTIMEQTANECVAPAAGANAISYIQIRGLVQSVRMDATFRAMTTRNTINTTTRTIARPAGWQ